MKTSRTRQAISGLAISIAIIVTLVCGVVLALAEGQSRVSERPTPTVYHIPTLVVTGKATRVPTTGSPATVVVIPTSIPAATGVKRPTATPFPSVTVTPTSTSTPASCQGKAGWQPYRVMSGDTLSEIAYRYGVSLAALMNANCLTNGDNLRVATTIYVPPVTPRPRVDPPPGTHPVTTPAATGTQTATDGACSNPDSVITSPKVGAVLRGKVKITGTARVPGFSYYTIEIRQEGTGQPYANLHTGQQEVSGGLLAELDTTTYPQGEYWLRLVVVDAASNYPERCAILVTISR